MDNFTLLQTYISEKFGISIENPDIPWRDTDGNSMQFVYLIFFIEEHFGFRVTDDMMDRMLTLGDMVRIIAEQERPV